jgi:hypothetical protein
MAGEPSSYSSSPLPFNAITNVIDIAASLAYVSDVVAEGQRRTTPSLHSALANFAPVRMALKVSRFCQEQVRSARQSCGISGSGMLQDDDGPCARWRSYILTSCDAGPAENTLNERLRPVPATVFPTSIAVPFTVASAGMPSFNQRQICSHDSGDRRGTVLSL